MKTSVNTMNEPKIPVRAYVEYFFLKYKKLSSTDLAVLISHKIKSKLPFPKLKNSIAIILNNLKKEGRIEKIKGDINQWQLVEKSHDY